MSKYWHEFRMGSKKFQSFTSMLKFEKKKTLFSPSSSQSHLSLILLSSRQFLQFGLKSSVLSSEKKIEWVKQFENKQNLHMYGIKRGNWLTDLPISPRIINKFSGAWTKIFNMKLWTGNDLCNFADNFNTLRLSRKVNTSGIFLVNRKSIYGRGNDLISISDGCISNIILFSPD